MPNKTNSSGSGTDYAKHPPTSRALHRVNELTARPTMVILAAAFVAASWVVIIATDFDSDTQFVFANVCASITVLMVFVLQHTQRRAQLALQLKLDELVHSLPKADERLVGVEVASDEELIELADRRLEHHESVRREGGT
jgi:low affinity Fe/Cu permease